MDVTTKSKINIVGAGSFAREVISVVRMLGGDVVSIFADDNSLFGTEILGVPIRGPAHDVAKAGLPAFIAIADTEVVTGYQDSLYEHDWVNIVHPTATVDRIWPAARHVFIGPGAVIGPAAAVFDFSIIRAGVTVEANSTVGIGCYLGDGVWLGQEVQLDLLVHVGAGTRVRGGHRIGQFVRIEPGTIVTTDVPSNVTVAGAPARITQVPQDVREGRWVPPDDWN